MTKNIDPFLKNWGGVIANSISILAALVLLRDIGCGTEPVTWWNLGGWLTLIGLCFLLLQIHSWASVEYPEAVVSRWVISMAALVILGFAIFPGGMLLSATC